MRKKNPIAQQLYNQRYRKRIVAMKTIYNRKKTEKPKTEVEDRLQGRRPNKKVED